MRSILFIISFFLFVKGEAQLGQPAVSAIKLYTLQGKKFSFNDSEELRVIIFLSSTCPLSQKYTLTLNELKKEFNGKAKFYGVFAEAEPVAGEYEGFRKKYDVQFALLVDPQKQLVKSLAATVTPEAVVLNKGNLVYHGAIDDWAIELGKIKKKAAINFVRNAIQCVMTNTTPFPSYTKPIGCFID